MPCVVVGEMGVTPIKKVFLVIQPKGWNSRWLLRHDGLAFSLFPASFNRCLQVHY